MVEQAQEYQLKIGVMHHPSLKTTQFIEFLQSESNQFLTQTLPESLPQPLSQNFIANYQSLGRSSSPEQYVGILVIYNAASVQSFEYAIDSLKKLKQVNGQLFILVIQMQAGQKKVNAIGEDGSRYCHKEGFIFVKLSIENSQDLVTQINKCLYELIQNYYYPNEQDKQIRQIRAQHEQDQKGLIPQQSGNSQYQSPYLKMNNQAVSRQYSQPQQYVLQYQQPNIIASKSERANMQGLLEKASRLRQYRQKQMLQQQKAIDESINNVEKVLNNINRHINDKMQSGWFSKLKDNLYTPIEKDSTAFAKIKLTQQFIDDFPQSPQKIGITNRAKTSLLNSFNKNSHQSRLIQNTTPINSRSLNTEPIMKIILGLEQDKVVEFELTQNSNIEQLAQKAIYLFGLRETQHNVRIMQGKIKSRIQSFVKQTERAIRGLQKKRISDRSFLRSGKKDK